MLTVAKPSSGSLLFHLNHPRNLKNLKMVLVRRVSKDSLAHELGFRRTFDFSNQRGLEGVDVFLRVHRFILPHNQRESRSRRSGHRGRHHVKFRRDYTELETRVWNSKPNLVIFFEELQKGGIHRGSSLCQQQEQGGIWKRVWFVASKLRMCVI